MAVDYNDKRFTAVNEEKEVKLNEKDAEFDKIIEDNAKATQDLIENSKEAAEVLKEEQNKQLDHQIETIEQQKEQSHKDYIKEQSGAYVDWQKESSKYGAKEEQLAAAGLTGSGYHESTQVSLYNTYQNRVAVARDAFERTKMNYENAINEAKLQNSSILAEIALNAHKEQLTLTLEGIQYKNQLLLEKANAKMQIESIYYSKWKDVLDQINTENALAEQQRQFNAQLLEEQRQFDILHSAASYTDDGITYSKTEDAAPYTGNRRAENAQQGIFETEYFRGSIPADTKAAMSKYGTFSNGYQPKGITGVGKVTKTGDTYTFETETLSGKKVTVTQTIWETEGGKLWYWEGREMKYKPLPSGTTSNSKVHPNNQTKFKHK